MERTNVTRVFPTIPKDTILPCILNALSSQKFPLFLDPRVLLILKSNTGTILQKVTDYCTAVLQGNPNANDLIPEIIKALLETNRAIVDGLFVMVENEQTSATSDNSGCS